ncbi:MAG TPA: hypothetical protein VGL06_08455 [Pseudonocardiaceae bacterium]
MMIDDAGMRERRVLTYAVSRPAVIDDSVFHSLTDDEIRRPGQLVQDRNGYWFPMLLFGLLILVAPLVYRPSQLPTGIDFLWNPNGGTQSAISGLMFAPMQQFGTFAGALGDPMSVALYWFCVVMFGPLITLTWYHLRARRLGTVPQTGWHLLYASASLALYVVLYPVIEFVTLNLPRNTVAALSPHAQDLAGVLNVGGFVVGLTVAAVAVVPRRSGRRLSTVRWTVGGLGLLMAIASAAAIEFVAYLQPRNSFGALLIISIGLLALSLVEPGRVCAVIAAIFTAVALATNLFGIRVSNALSSGLSPVHMAFTSLFLPGAVLVVGGLIGLAGCVRARRRAR